MPKMSVFAFERQYQQLAGPFYQIHREVGNSFSWEAMWGLPQIHAIVAYIRPDSEIALSLSGVVNNQSVLNFVDNQFANAPPDPNIHAPTRRGAIRTSYKTWGDILASPEAHINNSNAHQASELINTISVDFHCNTSWWLSALDGTIIIYAFFFLDERRRPRCRIEGFSDPVWDTQTLPDYGAAGEVSKRIAELVDKDEPILQALLNNALLSFAGDKPYSELYGIPGTGVTVGAPFTDDADKNVAVCLVP